MTSQENHSNRDDSSSESDDDSEKSVPVESLVAGRAKRSAAGNRYSSLIQAEVDQEDDVALLFAEDEEEEDNEFQEDDGADASDVQLDSSSDDDDQGPTAGADALEGEKEVQQQDRAERRKKRKAQELFRRPRSDLKKVKYDPTIATSISTPQPRPKKKSERTSWIPTPDQGPTRSSQRKQTVLNKEVTHLRLQESEVRRHRQIKVMEEAAKRKEAAKPKAMTQEDRMAEAARVEKANEKSLTKWEENEKKRVEEQKARLAALHNQQLKGPVITWWSGPAKWTDEKLAQVGSKSIQDAEVKRRKDDGIEKVAGEGRLSNPATASDSTTAPTPKQKSPENLSMTHEPNQDTASESLASKTPPSADAPPCPSPNTADPSTGHKDNLHTATVSLPSPNGLPSQVYSTPTFQSQQEFDGHYSGPASTQIPQPPSERLPIQAMTTVYQAQLPPPPRPKTPVIEIASRNLVALQNIDLNSTEPRLPELQDHVLLTKKPSKASSKQLHSNAVSKSANGKGVANGRQQVPCVITGQNAKYRDPKTGLAYSDSAAYKEIQKLRTGQTRWSEAHGCYTGAPIAAARGVPERFVPS